MRFIFSVLWVAFWFYMYNKELPEHQKNPVTLIIATAITLLPIIFGEGLF